jgi:hypothetical protein
MIEIEISQFVKSWQNLKDKELPKAIVKGFAKTAAIARDKTKQQTRNVFKLHSEYIPRGILSIPDPNKTNQMQAAIKAYRSKYHDFQCAVLVRGSTKPEKSLDFLILHEFGGIKEPHKQNKSIALPSKELKKYSYKTQKGRTRKRWKPAQLLEYYRNIGPAKKGYKKRQKKGRSKPKPFIFQSKKVPGTKVIARRLTSKREPYEILYALFDNTKIKRTYNFEKTVYKNVYHYLNSTVIREINKIT